MFFSDIDNDVGGGGYAAYLHTWQYTYMCIYDGIQYAYIIFDGVRTNAKKYTTTNALWAG